MTNLITVLKTSHAQPMAKSFKGPALKVKKFPSVGKFSVKTEIVYDFKSFIKLLKSMESKNTEAIIRGSMATDNNEAVSRTADNFVSSACRWCMIDVDSLAWDGDNKDQQAMLSNAIQQLPTEFQVADCWKPTG